MSDACNVVPLRREIEPDMVWVCICGCSTHYAHLDSTLECAACGLRSADDGGEWRRGLPETGGAQESGPNEPTIVVQMNDTIQALNRVLGKASADDTAAVIVIKENGSVHVWGRMADSREHRGWINRRLATAKLLLIEKKA